MERLTERYGDGYIAVKGCTTAYKDIERKGTPASNAIIRLAAYEDTGLEPEEVTAIKNAIMGQEIAKITEFDGIPIRRLQELAQAEKEGRLVVLPCGKGDELLRNGLTFKADHWNVLLTAFADDVATPSGKRLKLFYPEEAEAVLKKRKDAAK